MRNRIDSHAQLWPSGYMSSQLLDLCVDDTGRLFANGNAVASLARPFCHIVDLRSVRHSVTRYRRSVAEVMQAQRKHYRVQVGPRYFANLISSYIGGYLGFGIYRTNTNLSMQLRALA